MEVLLVVAVIIALLYNKFVNNVPLNVKHYTHDDEDLY